MLPLPMPEKYVREMVADWMGASKAYDGKWPKEKWLWWEKNREKVLSYCHPETIRRIKDRKSVV